jgi:hypothetical protein
MSEWKAPRPPNLSEKSVELATFHAETSELKASALPNICLQDRNIADIPGQNVGIESFAMGKHSPHVVALATLLADTSELKKW